MFTVRFLTEINKNASARTNERRLMVCNVMTDRSKGRTVVRHDRREDCISPKGRMLSDRLGVVGPMARILLGERHEEVNEREEQGLEAAKAHYELQPRRPSHGADEI